MSSTTTTTRTVETHEVPVMHKCRACRHLWRGTYTRTRTRVSSFYDAPKFFDARWSRNGAPLMTMGGLPYVNCPACGSSQVSANAIRAYRSTHECDARCTSAKGHNCECSCQGKNHGKDWEPVE